MASFIVYGDSSGQVTVAAPSVAGSNTITFPAETGTLVTTTTTTPIAGQIAWDTTVKTSGFTAVAYGGYFCNTTSAAFTVTLPSSPTRGQFVVIVDYAGTSASNNITVAGNGSKINGFGASAILATNRQGITFTYIDSTQGWLASSNVYGGATPYTQTYTATYLIVAGGGGGGGRAPSSAGGGGGGAGGYVTGTTTLTAGTVYTAVVGGGGGGGNLAAGTTGTNSTFTGLTASSGGGGGAYSPSNGLSGGSGGGGTYPSTTGGSGTPGQGNAGGSGAGGGYGAGGGGAGGVGASYNGSQSGAAGGLGTANSITGSSVTYAGGGGGGAAGPNGGLGGPGTPGISGGDGAIPTATAGVTNTGGGGGGGYNSPGNIGANGGSGVVILSVPTASYSGVTTGSPTITTSGSNTIIKWTTAGSGTYTAQGIIMAKMTIEELIKEFSNEQGFQFGIDIVMKSLRPGALYGLSASGGTFKIVSWDETNELPAPSSQEIRDEYIRHQTIKEFLEHLEQNKEFYRRSA